MRGLVRRIDRDLGRGVPAWSTRFGVECSLGGIPWESIAPFYSVRGFWLFVNHFPKNIGGLGLSKPFALFAKSHGYLGVLTHVFMCGAVHSPSLPNASMKK